MQNSNEVLDSILVSHRFYSPLCYVFSFQMHVTHGIKNEELVNSQQRGGTKLSLSFSVYGTFSDMRTSSVSFAIRRVMPQYIVDQVF